MSTNATKLSDRIETIRAAAKAGVLATHAAASADSAPKVASAWGPAMRV